MVNIFMKSVFVEYETAYCRRKISDTGANLQALLSHILNCSSLSLNNPLLICSITWTIQKPKLLLCHDANHIAAQNSNTHRQLI